LRGQVSNISETWPDKRANIVHNADFDSWNGFYNQTEFSYSYGKEQIKETVRDYVL
jgi:formyltetrahydrofolate hydrolase